MKNNKFGFRIFDHYDGKVAKFKYRGYEISMSSSFGGGVAVYNKNADLVGTFRSVEVAIEWVNKCIQLTSQS